ncbi:hypothetical protein PLICRDRAFT_96135 [Plicaturopsis crispa FD-325 SS-3]|nr:hypothetical protein PLICRDRAFT_96135 [Plicaturopsis crispa FD-325 SS-3]
MRATAAVFVSLVASAVAYQVTTPSATSGWTTGGPNTLAWDRVDSDRLNFTAVLVNQDRSVLPTNNEVLAALVDGTKGSITVSAPSGGWPVGSAFQVNLVQDSSDVNTILAQSAQFNITSSGSSSSSGASTTTAASSS